ncbi:helix-turn-helix domain-containing protein [Herbidospora cretacea]|uniref:helix-turn-helix domain-containing protein n=1 Tax=Herbidospora cretacea TaxID=28444 RepID=UPI000773D523|nr:helix-turn-helix domain-containing protein [Herbidospora cretacea]
MTNTPSLPSLPDNHGEAEVIGLVAAGRLLGMGRTKAYRLAKAGEFPCRVLRIGDRYMVPVRGVRAWLGYADEPRRGEQSEEKD